MLTCDICKKEISGRREFSKRLMLPYAYANKAWQHKEFDLCGDCSGILNHIIEQTKCDFANGKYEVTEE